jgi:hypothetical protein
MLATIADIIVAYLIARNVKGWPGWVLALLAGAVIAVTYSLGLGALSLLPPGESVIQAVRGVPMHAIFCWLCTWGFQRLFRKS